MNAQLPVVTNDYGTLAPIELQELPDQPNGLIRVGLIIGASFFVLFLGWAAFARLDASAVGVGQVTVVGNRQAVQHRDGGVVAQLGVRDGQHVQAGQVLIRLSGGEVEAQERALASAVIDLQAQRARLEAELSGQPIQWPAEFSNPREQDQALVQRAMMSQSRQLALRRSSLQAAQSVTRQQEASIAQTSTGFAAQREATARQIASIQDQLDRARQIAANGFISMNYIRQLERTLAQLQGSQADFGSRVSASREQIGQARSEYLQTQRRWIEDAGQLLRETTSQLNDQRPRWEAARDRLDRLLIRAPATGRVVGLQVFTVGGVINAGQNLMDIVPDRAPLVVRANFSPIDIDGVVPGTTAEVKFESLHERDIPILLGEVRTVSADSLADQQTGQRYFTAEIVVPDGEIARLREVRGEDTGIRPGVPAQVFVQLRRRSALDYLLEPLTETFRRSGHER